MARLLLLLIPLALIVLVIWLPSQLPVAVLAFVGWAAISGCGVALVALLGMVILSRGMQS